ncbi:hypothetical protein BAL199_18381 [alpha proteobacterium BAL199]|jgi:hypothetical protein|nr:hypothetical protein BAL199_18381 [alpha proteobacterium BAL199]
MDSDINSFWLTAKGIGPRLSDGQGAERTMWATAVNLMGWIDVAVGARTVNVHVNPMVVSEMVVALLPEALKCASEGHRITINLISADTRPVSVCFADTDAAVNYLEASVRYRRGSNGRPSIDEILRGFDQDTEVQQAQAAAPIASVSDSGRSISSIERAMISAEALAVRLRTAEWLDADGRYRRRLADELPNDAPDMVLFAMHSLGWAAIERPWPHAGTDLRAILPTRIVIDPHGLEPATVDRLVELCMLWSDSAKPLSLAWWDGATWESEYGHPEQVADRIRHLVTARQYAQFPTTIQSIAIEPEHLPNDVAAHHRDLIARAVRTWWAYGGNGDNGSGLIEALEREGGRTARAKLVELDQDNQFRIAAYEGGDHGCWDEIASEMMVGKRLIDAPDRRLGRRVELDVQTAVRRGSPLVHRCTGVLLTNGGPSTFDWVRLSLPLYRSTHPTPRSVLTICMV